MLAVQLISNTFGSVALTITDPFDLDKFEEALKRGETNDGLIYDFTTQLGFTKEGRQFLKHCKELGQGIEELVVANIFEYNPNTYRWFVTMSGRVNLANYKINEVRLDTNINQSGFRTSFTNLLEQNVTFFNGANFVTKNGSRFNNGNPIVPLKLQPKTVLKESKLASPVGNGFTATDPTGVSINQLLYSRLNTAEVNINELADTFGYTSSIDDTIDTFLLLNDYLAKEAGSLKVTANGTVNFRAAFGAPPLGAGHIQHYTYRVQQHFRQVRGGVNILDFVCDSQDTAVVYDYDLLPAQVVVVPLVFNNDFALIDVQVGDVFFTWLTVQAIASTGSDPRYPNYLTLEIDSTAGSFWDYKQATTFPETSCDAVMIYECFERIAQTLTNQKDCFRSNALGRTDTVPAYDVDGEAALTAVTNGWAIRQLTSPLQNPLFRSLFFNAKELLDAMCMIFCLSWGFDELPDGTPIVRVEKKGHFFDNGLQIGADLGEMPLVEKMVDPSHYWQSVRFTYPDIKLIKQINAIDEFNTVREWVSTITQVKGKLEMVSTFSTSGYETEEQRRQTIASTNSPNDDTKFMFDVLRDGAPVDGVQGWKNRRDEGFSGITNLYSPETAYNLNFRPGKIAQRWKPFLAAVTNQLLDKTLKFSFGTGNYLLTCADVDTGIAVDEQGVVDLTGVLPVYVPDVYSFINDLTRDQWAIVKANQTGFFQFLDKGVKCRGFIKNVSRNHDTKETTFQLLKAYP